MHKITDKNTADTLLYMHAEALTEPLKFVYISITQPQGEYIYDLLIRKNIGNIVEFGCSLGVSTIYLAAAAKRNKGKVITTEIEWKKIKDAKKNFQQADVADYIEIREGDAMETLQDANQGIEFLLLDGAKDLYIPVLELLENKLANNALIYADNTDMDVVSPFLNYIESKPDKYAIEHNPDDSARSALIQYTKATL